MIITKISANQRRLLSVSDIAKEYGLKPSFVYHLKRYSKLPYIQIGKKILFRESDFLKFLESHLIDKIGGET
ncbi:MAG: helix-turn-helix domain-containing protein [Ignavibacteriales bacterium]